MGSIGNSPLIRSRFSNERASVDQIEEAGIAASVSGEPGLICVGDDAS